MRLIFGLAVAIVFSSLVMSSCSEKVQIATNPKVTSSQLIDKLADKHKPFEWFSAKGRIKVNDQESSLGGRTHIRMIKDSLVWMNFKKLSIEAARVMITPDTCTVVYRLDNLYEQGPLQEFLDFYKVDLTFSELQEVIAGRFPLPDAGDILDYRIDEQYLLRFKRQGIEYEYSVAPDFTITEIRIKDGSDRNVLIKLSNYDESGFSSRKEMIIFTPEEGESKMSIKLSNVEFDKPKSIKFEVPKHYIKI